MTLDKHKLDGIPQIKAKTLPAEKFEALLITAGYTKLGRTCERETYESLVGACNPPTD